MGFEVFLNCYWHGDAGAFPLDAAEAAFGDAIIHREVGDGRYFWRIDYPVLPV
jgi:hypothetical protein